VVVYPGDPVNVKWMGLWYDGVLSKVGPQKDLFKVHVATDLGGS